MKKLFNIKSLLYGILLGSSVFASYHYAYSKGYNEGYRNGDTQTFNCTDGSKIVYSKDELLHYRAQLLNAYDSALQWYYRGNKQEWCEVFIRPAAPARAIWSSFRRLALTSRVGGRWSDGGHGQTAGRFGHGGTR